MILHLGEAVYWGSVEVIFLAGTITALDEERQTVTVRIERATPNAAHLIGQEAEFFADGLEPLTALGELPPGLTDHPVAERQPLPAMDEAEKLRRAAAAAVHQLYGYHRLPAEQEQALIAEVRVMLEADPALRARTLATMDEILRLDFLGSRSTSPHSDQKEGGASS
ncbi:hypothetical protein KTAU_19340 [Thermogemmatispora aurantia]|uniref:Uncharacterized protein n=1 Tax=Thermogemmatispora aurantia TaxID=2045279 RepID=A0A5J4K9E2_9CHLR|nr:hypothetical protein [Thermogemmatispora aurantia]GER83297.1 hypothetical protein KTAU_19340 [Thermogemmatispora aurantia]